MHQASPAVARWSMQKRLCWALYQTCTGQPSLCSLNTYWVVRQFVRRCQPFFYTSAPNDGLVPPCPGQRGFVCAARLKATPTHRAPLLHMYSLFSTVLCSYLLQDVRWDRGQQLRTVRRTKQHPVCEDSGGGDLWQCPRALWCDCGHHHGRLSQLPS